MQQRRVQHFLVLESVCIIETLPGRLLQEEFVHCSMSLLMSLNAMVLQEASPLHTSSLQCSMRVDVKRAHAEDAKKPSEIWMSWNATELHFLSRSIKLMVLLYKHAKTH